MKNRKGFVTNSSSSSFIVGKKENSSITVESVFSQVKEFYNCYFQKKEELINYIKSVPDAGIYYDSDAARFKFSNGNSSSKENKAIRDFINQQFGIDIWDFFNYYSEWLTCNTYQEYEEFWKEKIKKGKYHAPFTIGDFSNKGNITWLHWSKNKECIEEPHDISATSEIFEWYEEEQNPENILLNWKYDDSFNRKYPDNVICTEEFQYACLYSLGRICIYSECGYIPDYVVERLISISEYSCNHMG